MQKRRAAGIKLRSLRFSDVTTPEHSKELKQIKTAKEKIPCSVVIWDDNVAFVNDTVSVFKDDGTMKEWFDTLWVQR